jgi:hypothetical protein
MSTTTTPDLSALIQLLIREFPELQALYLFGSRANGVPCLDSDLDLALLLPPNRVTPGSPQRWLDARAGCEELVRLKVDLLDLRRCNTVLQVEVLRGRRLVDLDDRAIAEFEMQVISAYQHLNEERKGILARFHETGRAYAR